MANQEAVEPVENNSDVPPDAVKINVSDAKIILSLRQDLEQSQHENRLLKIALGDSNVALKEMRVEMDAIALQIAGFQEIESKKAKPSQKANSKNGTK